MPSAHCQMQRFAYWFPPMQWAAVAFLGVVHLAGVFELLEAAGAEGRQRAGADSGEC